MGVRRKQSLGLLFKYVLNACMHIIFYVHTCSVFFLSHFFVSKSTDFNVMCMNETSNTV